MSFHPHHPNELLRILNYFNFLLEPRMVFSKLTNKILHFSSDLDNIFELDSSWNAQIVSTTLLI